MSPRRRSVWTADHDATFEQVKKALVQRTLLALFDTARKIGLQINAPCLYGVGYEDNRRNWCLVKCYSRLSHSMQQLSWKL